MDQSIICGIDETGRGCCIGSMFIGGFITKTKDVYFSDKIKDSKVINKKNLEKLYNTIINMENTEFIVYEITSKELDDFHNNGINLNRVEIIYCEKIMNEILNKYTSNNKIQIIIDKFDYNLERHLLKYNDKCMLTIECKADAKYPQVSACSILLKTIRERHIKVLNNQIYNKDDKYPLSTSGYLGDKQLVKYLLDENKLTNNELLYYHREFYKVKEPKDIKNSKPKN